MFSSHQTIRIVVVIAYVVEVVITKDLPITTGLLLLDYFKSLFLDWPELGLLLLDVLLQYCKNHLQISCEAVRKLFQLYSGMNSMQNMFCCSC